MLVSRTSRSALAVALVALSACAGLGASDDTAPIPDLPDDSTDYRSVRDRVVESGRVDVDPTGNRVIFGPGDLVDGDPIEIRLDRTAQWILPTGSSTWVVVLDDGSSVVVTIDDGQVDIDETNIAASGDAVSHPPLATATSIASYRDFLGLFDDPLPDSRIVASDDALVALAEPTDRYPHGVLGDATEAAAVEVVRPSGESVELVRLDEPDVFEAVSPMVADVDGDGTNEVIVTVSNADVGARLVAYSFADGSVVAESEAIGLGNRWRNLLAVAPIGPNGEVEIVDVQTPHIGGILQFFRAEDGRMELVASAETFSTHSIGSRNLDLGIVSDADGDGRLDVILPTRGMDELVVVSRDDATDGGVREVGRVELPGRLVTNLAAGEGDDGVTYAVGLDDGTMLLWP